MKKDRFVLAYCHPGMVHTDFMTSVLDMLRIDGSTGRHLFTGQIGIRGLYVAQSRNEAVVLFRKQEHADWMLFVDTDIIFTTEQVYALIDAANEADAPIMAGTYFGYLSGKLWPVLFSKNADGMYYPIQEFADDRVQPIAACGMGFTLIHRRVFDALYNEADPWCWFGHDLYMGKRMGEDICFCERASKAGFSMFADGRVTVSHIKSRAESLGTWLESIGPEVVVRQEKAA
ncbi:MAG: hypothetical protein WBQ34_10095 [Candidatus Acidiferrales bacterium]